VAQAPDSFVEATIDLESPYVGQPLVYTIRVFTTRDIENTTVDEPLFSGFGRATFEAEPTVASETRDGIAYNVIEHPLLLYPLRPGQHIIDPLRIHIPETPFEPELIVETEPIPVAVRALPDAAPDTFKNAVGQFDVQASVDHNNPSAGTVFIFSLTVTGTGNLEQIIAPDIQFPETWRVFSRQPISELSTLRLGSKTFQWTIIADTEGQAEIPSAEFSFFNPQSQVYETRLTTPVALTIDAASLDVQQDTDIAETTIVRVNEPGPLKAVIFASGLTPLPPLGFWLLWLIPPAIVLILWLPRRVKIPPPIRRRRQVRGSHKALKHTMTRLRAVQKDNPRLAYEQIGQAILDYLSMKVGKSITLEDVPDAISHLPVKLQHVLLQTLEDAASAQYAPVTENDVTGLLQQTLKVLNAVDKVWK
jgi:hypothetical protein